ncbi:hypothetical protein CW354_14505 [Marinicaulis flavus]|uniref:Uncharacterized protein n=2 Tax=Hyphococcus luteus TaxID=2058213 RepID=A0A2S7K2H1_9PROT|nr:hypothetical protein CW354_14505 [Marinicaulis flavus]
MDVTTQELFLRLGTTSLSRSARADALFRRLRSAEQDQLAGDLMRAPKRVKTPDAQNIQREPKFSK